MANNAPPNGIGQDGVTANGQVFSWDEFNGIDPKMQRMILANAGVPQDQIDGVLKTVQKMEVGEFQDYQANKQGKGGKSGSWMDAIKYGANPLNWGDTDYASQFARKERGTKESTSEEKARQYKESGLGGLIDQINTKSKQDAAAGVTSQQGQQQGQGPWSIQNLNDYWNNFVKPARDDTVRGIDQTWNSLRSQMRGVPGGAVPGMAMMMAGLDNEARATAFQNMVDPYMKQANAAMSGGFNAGIGYATQGYQQQQIMNAINTAPPAVKQWLQGGGGSAISALLGGTGAGSINPSAITGMTPQIQQNLAGGANYGQQQPI